MKHCTRVLAVILLTGFIVFAGLSHAEDESSKMSYKERLKAMEERFFAASKAGKTITGVLVEGNSLFNGTTEPQNKPFGKPYTDEELLAAKISAERNSKIFLLAKDGTLYYPCPKKGQKISESEQAHRFPRVLTEEQKKKKMFTWSTLVPLVGRVIEVYGEIYTGYAGVKGIHIESIYYEGEYLVGE